jgi:hypothetical protein
MHHLLARYHRIYKKFRNYYSNALFLRVVSKQALHLIIMDTCMNVIGLETFFAYELAQVW